MRIIATRSQTNWTSQKGIDDATSDGKNRRDKGEGKWKNNSPISSQRRLLEQQIDWIENIFCRSILLSNCFRYR